MLDIAFAEVTDAVVILGRKVSEACLSLEYIFSPLCSLG